MSQTSSRQQVSSRTTNPMPKSGKRMADSESELNTSKRGAKSTRSSVESSSRSASKKSARPGKKSPASVRH